MTHSNAKRQRLSPRSDVCSLPSDLQRIKQISISSFCFRRPTRLRRPQTPPTPFLRTNIETPPTESNRSQITPPSPKSPPPNIRKCNRPPKKKLAQVFLDCGQKNWGQVICNQCGTLYVPGVAEDTKMHNRVCKSISLGVPWHSTSHCKVLHKFLNNKFTILMIRPADFQKHLGKLQQTIAIVETDLGMKNCRDPDAFVFLCLCNNRVVGFLSAKPVSEGYKMLDLYERGTTPIPCMLGVAVLWTHSSFRHQGIATHLVEAARANVIFGMVVPKSKLAFSSPTEAGWMFAKTYCGQDPLVCEYNQ
eukprot:scaffold7316_cov123-Cylindrotheca_fusiformis.AAC.12